jgi:hypothetical protein
LICIQIGQVPGGRDDGDIPLAPLRGLADAHQLQLVGGVRQLLEVAQRVVISGEIKIVAGLVPQHGFRGGRLGQRGTKRSQQENSSNFHKKG